jgi:dTDP-4-amino-4,6-dideoxygalactose transaminase
MRLTEAQAAFGVVQLRKLDKFNKTQTENAEYFLQHLKSPPFRSLYSFPIPKGVKPTYYLMPVVEDSLCNGYSREYFLRWAKDKGISLGVPSQNIGYYKKLIYEAPIFRNARVHDCPNARWAKDNVLLFDIHRWKTIEYMKKVLAVL